VAIGPAIVGALRIAAAAYRHRDLAGKGSLDPQQIMADACDPNGPPPEDVMARAAMRSKTGKLVEAAAECLARSRGIDAGSIARTALESMA
jgi:hypothetical protein